MIAVATTTRLSAPTVVRLVFEVEAQDPLALPAFAGSTLRGTFGHALRRLACMTGAPSCVGCGLLSSCHYPAVFELPAVGYEARGALPAPYAFEPPDIGATTILPGERWRFGLRLFGDRSRHAAIVVEAMRRACGIGLTARQARGRLERVLAQARHGLVDIYDPVTGRVELPEAVGTVDPSPASGARIALVTPLRVQSNGKRLVPRDYSTRRLTADIVRRARGLLEVAGSEAERAAAAAWPVDAWLQAAAEVSMHAEVSWFDWRRSSTRQGRLIDAGGWLGTLELTGPIGSDLAAVLALGARIGVGKECVYGFGQYDIEYTGT